MHNRAVAGEGVLRHERRVVERRPGDASRELPERPQVHEVLDLVHVGRAERALQIALFEAELALQ